MTTLETAQAMDTRAKDAPPLTVRLAAVRRRSRAVALQTGLSSTVLAFLITCAATLVVDRLVPLSFVGRFLALAACLTAGTLGLALGLLRVVLRPVDDDDLALRVEGHFGGLRNLLISALQLKRERVEPGISPALIDAVSRQAHEDTRHLNFLSVVATTRLARLAVAAAVVAAASTAYTLLSPAVVRAWALRLLHPFDAEQVYPTRTRLTPVTGHLAVPAGERATVSSTADGHVPSEGLVHYEQVSGASGALACRVDTADGRTFRLTLEHVTSDTWYWFEVGDASTWRRRGLIEALPRPELTDLVVSAHPPAYTLLPDPPPQRLRDVEALAGSVIRLEGEARVPAVNGSRGRVNVDRATLVLASGARTPMDVSAAGRVVGRFPLRRDDAYQIHLAYDHRGKDGRTVTVASDRPIWYRIRALPDKPPVIEMVEPGPTIDAAPVGAVMLRVNIADDYGVRGASLCYTIRKAPPAPAGSASGETPPPVEDRAPVDRTTFTRVDLPGRFRSRRVAIEHNWLIAKTGAQVGDRILYFVSASDTRDDPGPNVAESELYEIRVVSLAEIERQQRDRLESIQREIERIYERERDLRGEVERMRTKGSTTQPAGGAAGPDSRPATD